MLQGPKARLSLFQQAVRHPTRCLRWAAVFPVTDTDNTVRYDSKLLYQAYSVLFLLGQCVTGLLVGIWFFSRRLNTGSLPNVIFFGNGCLMAILLVKMARRWPELVQKASIIEAFMPDAMIYKNVLKKCSGLFLFFFCFGILEHLLSKIYLLHMMSICLYNNTAGEIFEKIEYTNLPFLLGIINDRWLLVFFELIVIQSTCISNLVDILIMCLSVYISSHFKKLNDLIHRTKTDVCAPWKEYREYHSLLIEFLHLMNRNLGPFILLSMFQNLFFICIQMFNMIDLNHAHRGGFCKKDMIEEAQHSLEHTLYYMYSSVFLIVKTLTIMLVASEVQTVARQPIFDLCFVPDELYGVELRRFSRELRYTKCAISGIYFDITKDKIAKVIGQIITYELILLQLRQFLQVPVTE